MANINEIEKDIHTNTFWVNPTKYDDHGEVIQEPDELGVSFPEPSYRDGIEVPDKLVTINGATNYHILDAINLNWDRAAIPWATKITKWSGSGTPVEFAPNYIYNKPNQDGWTDGTIKETEDIADILNYLIYRVVSLDYFVEHWNEYGLQNPALRLVNHRTDWYSTDINPDLIDGDKTTMDVDKSSDNRFTVRSNGLIINLYPYLVSRYWEGPDDTNNVLNTSYKTKLLDSDGNNLAGVVMSDTGWDAQRSQIYKGDNRKIVRGHENFDIFEVETRSTSNQIEFISRNKHAIDGYVQKSVEVVENPDGSKVGGVKTITTIVSETSEGNILQTNYLYKLPIVAYKCLDTDVYPYDTYDIIKTLLRYNYVGIQNSIINPLIYKEPRNTQQTPQFDPSFINATFGITIAKTENAINGFASGSNLYNVTIYKGDNTLIDLSLKDKSIIETDSRGNPLTITFKNSHNENVVVNRYKTTLNAPADESVYEVDATADLYKTKINFEAEFGPTYDRQHNGNDDEMLKKSSVYPYFIVKLDSDTTGDYLEIWRSVNVEAYRYIYSNEFDGEHSESFTLFSHIRYGKVTYEKDGDTWSYYYYPPAANNIYVDSENKYYVKLFGLMYYPIDDITTNRLLNPLWAELSITIQTDGETQTSIDFSNISTSDIDPQTQYISVNDVIVEDGYILSNATSINNEGYIIS